MKLSEINFTFKNTAIVLLLVVIGIAVYKTGDILLMFLISVLIAYLLNPVVRFFEKIHIPRTLGVFILVVITGAILFLALALVLPTVIEDTVIFVNNLPDYINKLFTITEKALNYFNVEMSLDKIKAFIVERIGLISKYVINTLTSAAASVTDMVMVLLNLFLIPVLVFFLLKDFPQVKDFTSKVVKKLHMETVMGHVIEFESLVGRYFRGMFLVGLVLSVLYVISLLIIGVKGAVLLGLLTGMGGMIPYVGFAVGIVVSVIITAIQFQDWLHPIYVVIAFIVVQILESTVITPKIVGDSLGLNPVIVIVGLMIGGALFGLLGMLLALPAAAFIKILLNKYFFKEEPAGENNKTNPPELK